MHVPTLILGAGAAGLMCAAHAGPGTLIVDHARAPGEKIRISGGGRCNFTNMHCDPGSFLSHNPHFAKSALSRYTQWDFLDLVQRHDIPWHEKTLGQLFCDRSARDIVAMLLTELDAAGATLWLQTHLRELHRDGSRYAATLERDGRQTQVSCDALVVATGGKSIPKMGATGLAYDIARQFGIPVTDTRPGLVPLTFPEGRFSTLAGVATPCRASVEADSFDEAMLFTHRGLSGPAILQISSYWREGDPIAINLLPDHPLPDHLRPLRRTEGRRALTTELARLLPARLVDHLGQSLDLKGNIADLSDTRIDALADALHHWQLTPSGSEGYRTAEVTLGGIDTDALSSRTMMTRAIPGLYFIGEAVDVTGWLGGYNFQWAWSSGFAAGTAITLAKS
ncbi:NAD(P)/FAD-dependent oxidoreductase [Puniceibacterium sp. IMCC21224]|uniref:NAD(P)/FAD-dependent oxidoreductase n=1 Tax=Puniceibacterium sp. IMCC21224 TaxID=1618204 RepID=UPI00064D93B3|nr:NAD(P)/FAD-dependent oxidoreductase [Puniceibacterium sp. IMCC21224]KMK67895.1 flavoprotein, HI0933 family [Puniceibacterium sp. IMCC21224]